MCILNYMVLRETELIKVIIFLTRNGYLLINLKLFRFSQHVTHVIFLFFSGGSVYFCHILLHIQLCKNFTFVHFIVPFDYYQVESEFKYSVRNNRDN